MMMLTSDKLVANASAARTETAHPIARIWYDRPVRWQILLAFLAITLVATIVAGIVIVMDARDRAEIEVRAPIELAARYVQETTRNLSAEQDIERLPHMLAEQLRHLRHVRIAIVDREGNTHVAAPQVPGEDEHEAETGLDVPEWFTSVVSSEMEPRRVNVMVDGHRAVTVFIAGEPAYEIAEVWGDLKTLGALWLGANAMMMLVLYVVLGRILNPLATLGSGMRELEDGHYGMRLAPPKVRELRVIADRFNELAAALGATREENNRLYRDLVLVQEEERRLIATELHDEVGPCLFGITANVSSIEKLAHDMPHDKGQQLSRRVGQVLTITERLKAMNRRLLKTLRPVALGRITLSDLVSDLIGEFEQRHPNIRFRCATENLARSYGERTDLTIYRSIQEGVTNALRHGQPGEIAVELSHLVTGDPAEGTSVQLVLRDDGKGISPSTPIGFGLRTMRERVRAQGGNFSILSRAPSGTTITIVLPVPPGDAKVEGIGELIESTR